MSKPASGRANVQLDYRLFEPLLQLLYQRCDHAAPDHAFRFRRKLFSLDASLIDVSMKVFRWVNCNNRKAALQLHAGLDYDGLVPAFAALTLSKVSEIGQARQFQFPRGSVVVFDKG